MRSILPYLARTRELLPPFGCETALWGRPLTMTEENETIIINRSDRSTYPDGKSVLRSGATPQISSIGRGTNAPSPRDNAK